MANPGRICVEGFFVAIRVCEGLELAHQMIRRTVVDVTVEFDRLGDDELHRIMTSGPKRWDATSTTAGVLVEADSSGVKLPSS